MLLPDNERSRPTANRAASNVSNLDNTSVPRPTHNLDALDALAAHIDGTFVVVVKVSDGRYRRRCYLTAKSAENAARKATERGENAVVYMAELKPLWRISGGEPL